MDTFSKILTRFFDEELVTFRRNMLRTSEVKLINILFCFQPK